MSVNQHRTGTPLAIGANTFIQCHYQRFGGVIAASRAGRCSQRPANSDPRQIRHNFNQIQWAIENSDPERPWTFKGEPLYVRRALRVEYTYREQNWDKTDYLIVLYQCSGGCC